MTKQVQIGNMLGQWKLVYQYKAKQDLDQKRSAWFYSKIVNFCRTEGCR